MALGAQPNLQGSAPFHGADSCGTFVGVMPSTDSIAWLDWGADTFARATAEQKPILLFIGTAWCRWTAEMDRFSYRDPRVVRLVADRFLPVRVDAERRPDVSARYTLDGWPTTAFLTPDGDLLGGGTHLDADALTAVLADVAEAFARQRADIDVRAAAGRITVPGKADPGGSVDLDEGAAAGGKTGSGQESAHGAAAARTAGADAATPPADRPSEVPAMPSPCGRRADRHGRSRRADHGAGSGSRLLLARFMRLRPASATAPAGRRRRPAAALLLGPENRRPPN